QVLPSNGSLVWNTGPTSRKLAYVGNGFRAKTCEARWIFCNVPAIGSLQTRGKGQGQQVPLDEPFHGLVQAVGGLQPPLAALITDAHPQAPAPGAGPRRRPRTWRLGRAAHRGEYAPGRGPRCRSAPVCP